jgi:uncharacterized protein with NRDE domain
MCTVLLAHRPAPGLLLAASTNRNEFLARPAEPLAPWPRAPGGQGPRIVAPRDGKASGTWQGINDRGLFVCLTNRRHAQLDAGRVSRGQLVAEALALPDARSVHEYLGTLVPNRHNGFHLLAADLRQAFLCIGDGERLERRALEPGLHLITERSFGAGEGRREEEARAAFAALFAAGLPTVEQLRTPMQAHAGNDEPLESACVHAELFGYGTRSSLQLSVPAAGPVRALWSEGKTCTAPAVDVSGLLAPLFAAALLHLR